MVIGTDQSSGSVRPDPVALFGHEAVERGRRYHRPLYVALLVDLALALGTLSALAFGPAGEQLRAASDDVPWWIATPAATAVALGASWLVRLPLALWRGWWRERRWGLSTQSLRGFLADRVKAWAVAGTVTALALVGLGGAVRLFPSAWPVVAAAAAAGLVLALGAMAPVLLEPLFNRFVPLADQELARRVESLAERAGVPVRHVLVADASRRTRKLNAYVSGVGRTRRVVVYDTLVDCADPREVEAVVAHELGHRRERHVVKGTLLGMAEAVFGTIALWVAFGSEAGDPARVPEVLLLLAVLQLFVLPLDAAISRRWERVADRYALQLTADAEGVEGAFRRLARANVADLDPPRVLHALVATHPTLAERVAAARSFATVAS